MPPLTTIRQDLVAAADTILRLLFSRIAGDDTPSVRIPLTLIERRSA